jgi:hypothetical protein
VRSLLHHGADHFRSRTLNLLREPGDSTDARDVLIRTVKDELSEWDGSIQSTSATGPDASATVTDIDTSHFLTPPRRPDIAGRRPAPENQQIHASLRLCMQLDSIAGIASVILRCSTRHEFPEIGLQLYGKPHYGPFCCVEDEDLDEWSSPLTDCNTGTVVDAAQFDWTVGLELRDNRFDWRSTLTDTPVRIFVSGAPEGLRGLVEISQLPRGMRFYIAVTETATPQVRNWGQRLCQDFKEIKLRRGLPPRWRLFSCATALNDQGIRDIYPSLSFSHVVRLATYGGLRSSRGNNFFDYGLPDVVLEGGDGSEKLYCSGEELAKIPDSSHYKLPLQSVTANEIAVRAERNHEAVAKLFLYVTHDIEWKGVGGSQLFDRFGGLIPASASHPQGVAGAYLSGIPQPNFAFLIPEDILQGLQVYLIGRSPGQIINWPKEQFDTEWAPVWAIQFLQKKRARAVFCGGGADEIAPLCEPWATADRKRLKLWKEILWYHRRKITSLSDASMRKLWVQYQEVAREVR